MDGTRDAGRAQDGVAADKTRIVEAKYKDATRLLSQLLAKTDHAQVQGYLAHQKPPMRRALGPYSSPLIGAL